MYVVEFVFVCVHATSHLGVRVRVCVCVCVSGSQRVREKNREGMEGGR